MSDLVVIVYETEAKTEEMRKKVFDLQKEYLIELGDAAIAVKQPAAPQHDSGWRGFRGGFGVCSSE